MQTVNVARDFTRFPSGRYKRNGATSGQAFREQFLEPPLLKGENVTVELDGTLGYGSSFLEEAFGGTVRTTKLLPEKVLSQLQIVSTDAELVAEVKQYILEAKHES